MEGLYPVSHSQWLAHEATFAIATRLCGQPANFAGGFVLIEEFHAAQFASQELLGEFAPRGFRISFTCLELTGGPVAVFSMHSVHRNRVIWQTRQSNPRASHALQIHQLTKKTAVLLEMTIHKLVGMLLLALAGCGGSASPPIPPTTGDFVRNNGSVGTAKVFGIEFRVNVTSNGATFEDLINARKRFTFGKDITIQLDSVDESVVGFIFNDQDYGNLNVGDQVVIDDERNVEVNGTPRPPKSRE